MSCGSAKRKRDQAGKKAKDWADLQAKIEKTKIDKDYLDGFVGAHRVKSLKSIFGEEETFKSEIIPTGKLMGWMDESSDFHTAAVTGMMKVISESGPCPSMYESGLGVSWSQSPTVWVWDQELVDDLDWTLKHLRVNGDDNWSFSGTVTHQEYRFKILWRHRSGKAEKSSAYLHKAPLGEIMLGYKDYGFEMIKNTHIIPAMINMSGQIFRKLMEVKP